VQVTFKGARDDRGITALAQTTEVAASTLLTVFFIRLYITSILLIVFFIKLYITSIMTLTLTAAVWDDLWDQSWEQTGYSPPYEPFVQICKTPAAIGNGTFQSIELYPEVWLGIGHRTYPGETIIEFSEAEHPIQLGFMLSGKWLDSNEGQLSPTHTMISGSGIQRELASKVLADQGEIFVEIVMSPDRLAQFFPDAAGQLPAELNFLVKGDDWQTLIYPPSTPAIQRTVQEIVTCPYQGFEKRLFLQGKVHDLIGLQLMSVLRDRGSFPSTTRLKPETIARLHHAKDLLAMQLEHPPSLSQLAQQVGISDRTLQRGFQTLFNTTVMGYLTEQRLKQAKQLLRQGATEGLRSTRTVTEVATMVGYRNMGHFAMAFKRRFGITPSQCLAGKVADFE
jgi:AraC-like DNA-binding protein